MGLTNVTSWQDFEGCADVFANRDECQDVYADACGKVEPKCCRCMTMEPLPSNQKHGCLLEIFKGDPCGSTCDMLPVSSGSYPRDGYFFGRGKDNYRFYGNCSEADDKGGELFTQHDMCPTPWAGWA